MQDVFFVKQSLAACIGTSARSLLRAGSSSVAELILDTVFLLGNVVLDASIELGKYEFYQILKNSQLRLKPRILPFASENSVQFASQVRYFKSGKFKAIITIMYVTRLCLTNEYDCSDLLRVSPGSYLSQHHYH